MIISYSHHFIFIHVPKTAGMSVDRALGPYAHQTEHLLVNRLLALVGIHVNHYFYYRWRRFRRHTTARVVQRRLPRSVYQDCFKFAFVRNPWDRMVSQYHYILRNPSHHRHRLVSSMAGFEEYLKFETKRNKHSQKQFVTDTRGRLIVDFVGRFERLRDDFDHVCRTLNIDVVLPHANRTSHPDYRVYYDRRTMGLVAFHCRDDIDLFEYSFDDGVARALAG